MTACVLSAMASYGIVFSREMQSRFTSGRMILIAVWGMGDRRAKGEVVVGQESVKQDRNLAWHGDSGGDKGGSIFWM